MNTRDKFISRRSTSERAARMVESVFRCKWSLTVYHLLSIGIRRPGEMVRNVEGLSTKVLNDCLRKNMEFGIIERVSHAEIPPRVEYFLTPVGEKFIRILRDLEALQTELDAAQELGALQREPVDGT